MVSKDVGRNAASLKRNGVQTVMNFSATLILPCRIRLKVFCVCYTKSSLTHLSLLTPSITMKVLSSELFLLFHYDCPFYPCRAKGFVGFFS